MSNEIFVNLTSEPVLLVILKSSNCWFPELPNFTYCASNQAPLWPKVEVPVPKASQPEFEVPRTPKVSVRPFSVLVSDRLFELACVLRFAKSSTVIVAAEATAAERAKAIIIIRFFIFVCIAFMRGLY